MRKEIVEKIYLHFNDFNEEAKLNKIKEARKDEQLVDWYIEIEYESYELCIKELKIRYGVDFDIEFFPNTSDIKSLKFLDDKDLLHLNYDQFYDELLEIVNAYREILNGYIDDYFDEWVRDYFIDSEIEFLVGERLVENA